MPGQVITIRDFTGHFTVSQNRRNEGPFGWIAVKTKHDGKGFRRLMMHDHGAAIYGAFLLMVQVASKCPKHGVLADEDGPLTTEDLELKTGCPKKVFDEAIEVLSSKGIAWIQIEAFPTALGAPSNQVCYVTGRNGTERNDTSVRTGGGSENEKLELQDAPAAPEIPCLKRVQDQHLGKTPALVELAARIRAEQPGHIPDGEDGLLRIIAAAERAKAQGKNPTRLFRWIIRHSRWDVLDGNEKSAAKRRLTEFHELTPPVRAGPQSTD